VDKHLGNESGDIALNKFKEKNPYKHTKYILCSGDVTPANRESFLSLGFDDAIPKDFHLETIRSILDEF
jgi:CheY-like chemotaxis protein